MSNYIYDLQIKNLRDSFSRITQFCFRFYIIYMNTLHDSVYVLCIFSHLNCERVLVARSCPTLCYHMGCSPPGSSVHGISQARILEWVVISSSEESSQLRDQIPFPVLAGGFPTAEPLGSPVSLHQNLNIQTAVSGGLKQQQ